MEILDILEFPDPRLRIKSEPVEEVNESLQNLAAEMAVTMYANSGIGLAAPQVNVHKRMMVIDTSKESEDLMVFVNPEIISRSGEMNTIEGCLSVPGLQAKVKRSKRINLKFTDIEGNDKTKTFHNMKSACIQHEMDHFDGKIIIDYIAS
jgi:peptide deformylase